MTFTLDPLMTALAALVFLLGAMLGWALRGSKRRRIAALEADAARLTGERDSILAERDRLLTDLEMTRSQIRPLADEVDKLRRAAARREALPDPAAPIPPNAPLAAASLDPGGVPPDTELFQLKGVGDKFAARLRELGITRISQIAAWTGADVAVIDSQLGPFRGRIERDQLIEQARLLNEGRVTEYEARFGKLGS